MGLTGQQTSAVGGVVLDQIVISPTGQSVTAGVGIINSWNRCSFLTGQVATSGVGSLISQIGVPLTAPSLQHRMWGPLRLQK